MPDSIHVSNVKKGKNDRFGNLEQDHDSEKLDSIRLAIYISITCNSNTKYAFMKITSKGQVTIPQHIREEFGFLPHTEVEFVIKNENVLLQKKEQNNRRGTEVIQRLKGKGNVSISTDEIMALTRGKNQ